MAEVATLPVPALPVPNETMSCEMILNSFGSMKIRVRNFKGNNIVPFLAANKTPEERNEKFIHDCELILQNRQQEINNTEFCNLLFHMMNNDPTEINKLVFTVLTNATKDFKRIINEKLQQGDFSLRQFIEEYNKFYQNTFMLKKHLWYYDENVEIKNKNSSLSPYELLKNYIFYCNVKNTEYKYNGKDMNLYGIISSILEKDKVTIDTILPLFKMRDFEQTLSSLIINDTDKNKMFNVELNRQFMVTMGSNQEFVKSITAYLNNKIKEFGETHVKKEGQEDKDIHAELEKSPIVEILKMATQFAERDLFNVYYQILMERRLLNSKLTETNVTMERFLLTFFKKPEDNALIQKMNYKIDDIVESIESNNTFHGVKIRVTSEKYKDLDLTNFNLKMCEFKVLRSSAWDCNSEEILPYTCPLEIMPHVDSYIGFYGVKYGKMRKIKLNFDHGSSIINITLGDKTYEMLTTLPQMFLLMQFNKSKELSISELETALNVPRTKLAIVLNSLLRCQILMRDPGKANDPNNKFYLNNNFTCDQTHLSLASAYYKIINEKIVIANENANKEKLATQVLNIIKSNADSQMTFSEIYKKLDVKCTKDELVLILNDYMSRDIISESVNDEPVYKYKINTSITLKNDKMRGSVSTSSEEQEDDDQSENSEDNYSDDEELPELEDSPSEPEPASAPAPAPAPEPVPASVPAVESVE